MSEAAEEASPSSDPARPGPLRLLDRLLESALALTVLVASAAIFAQVVLRYLFNRPSVWADEFAVLVFAWMVFIGLAVVQRTDSHISMDTLVRLLPARARLALDLVRVAAMAVVLGVLFWQGLALAQRFAGLAYPAMGISRGFLYAALPVCIPFVMLYLVANVRHRLRQAAER